MAPTPFQLVKDRKIDANVGPQISNRSRVRGNPTMSTSRTLSRLVRRLNRRRRGATLAPAPSGYLIGAGGMRFATLRLSLGYFSRRSESPNDFLLPWRLVLA